MWPVYLRHVTSNRDLGAFCKMARQDANITAVVKVVGGATGTLTINNGQTVPGSIRG